MIARIILWGMILAIDLLISFPGHSQDNRWVDELMNANNNRCCYDNDGRRLIDPEWDTLGKVNKDWSGYRVYEDAQWHNVPNWAVVTQKNKDGIPRVWWNKTYVTKTLVCFLPGTLG